MSTTLKSHEPITVAEFLQRPEREDGQVEELIDGEILVSPGARANHTELVRRLERALRPLEEQGFEVLPETTCHLVNNSLPNPDAAVVLRTAWDRALSDGFLQEAPALAIEVVSPHERRMLRKAELYLSHGAQEVWLLYPRRKSISVLDQEGNVREARPGETIEFHGCSVSVDQIFRGL